MIALIECPDGHSIPEVIMDHELLIDMQICKICYDHGIICEHCGVCEACNTDCLYCDEPEDQDGSERL